MIKHTRVLVLQVKDRLNLLEPGNLCVNHLLCRLVTLSAEFRSRLVCNRQIEVGECLLSFGAESFVFQFAIQKSKD